MIYQKLKPFPSGFLWGASTSAYQVEGGVDEDGKSPSIIDMYEHPEGVADFSVASDHYHRYKGRYCRFFGNGIKSISFFCCVDQDFICVGMKLTKMLTKRGCLL